MHPVSVLLLAMTMAQQPDRSRALFRRVCNACHSYTIVEDQKKTAEDWHDTVQYMVDHGAKAGPAERIAIERYLVRTYAMVKVNTAPAEEIAQVLGLSLSTARAIVEHRPYRDSADINPPLNELQKKRIVFE